MASRIADYNVPAGFGDPYSVHLLAFSLVGYTGDDKYSHIYLCQFPKYLSLNQAEIERQFGEATYSKWSDRPARMAVVDQRTVTIRGQEVTLVVSEGTNSEGSAYREVNALFQGKGGQAIVNLSAPIQSWDDAVVDQFLASIQ